MKPPRTRYRTLWISDTHLGSRGAQANMLSAFLKGVECDRLYLVGDFIDFWRLRSRPHWPACHNEVLRRLLKMIKRGTRIIIVPGNHDEVLRQYLGVDFGGFLIQPHVIHDCADGRRLLVTHGDQFDLVVTHSRLLSLIGSAAYEWLLVINRWYNRWRRWRGRPYWSLSQYLKLKVKSACSYVSKYRETLEAEATRRGLDGVICGHIHKPEILLDRPIQYFNCGDWVENCTALAEHEDGRIELLHAHMLPSTVDPLDEHDDDLDDAFTFMDATSDHEHLPALLNARSPRAAPMREPVGADH